MFSIARLSVAFLAALILVQAESEQDAATAKTAEDENDPTKLLLKQLTIGMMDVVDERTVSLRHTSTKEGKGKRLVHMRLGNAGPVPRGSLSDDAYAEKVNAAKAALVTLVDKQALWYKVAPDSVQPPSSGEGVPDVIIADIWSKGGRHVNSALKKDGHLSEIQEYESEIARDILGAAAKDAKEESYKKLGEAMKEHEKEKQAAEKASRATAKATEDAEAASEGFGVAGWLGIALLASLGVGIATNFGKPSGKKTNLNRKKGKFEQLWMKLKGA